MLLAELAKNIQIHAKHISKNLRHYYSDDDGSGMLIQTKRYVGAKARREFTGGVCEIYVKIVMEGVSHLTFVLRIWMLK